MNLGARIDISRIKNAVAAGTTDQQSSTVDMAGWDGVILVAAVGTLSSGAVTSLRAQDSADDSTYADLASSDQTFVQSTDSNKSVWLDIYRPRNRYVQATLKRATGNAVIDGIFAIRYRGSKYPVTQGSTVAKSKQLVSPAQGTA